MRQLDLEFPFGAACPLREDIENQAGAVNHPAIERTLEIALLNAAKSVIENDQIGAGFEPLGCDFGHLATTSKQRRIGLRSARSDDAGDVGTRG